LCIALGLYAAFGGGWSIHLSTVTVGDHRGRKPFTLGVLCFAVAGLTTKTVREWWVERSHLGFYALGSALAFALCLGPVGLVFGRWLLEKPPYFWLMKLPGGDALRVPTRCAMVGYLCLAMAAALLLGRMYSGVTRSRRQVFNALVVGLTICDFWPRPMPVEAAPARAEIPAQCQGSAILELPMGSVVADASAMYRGMFHGQPVVNGYSGYSPTPYNILARAVGEYDESILPALAEFGSLCIAINTDGRQARAYERLALQAGAAKAGSAGGWSVYFLQRRSAPSQLSHQTTPIMRADDGGGGACAECATDGNEETNWSSLDTQQSSHQLLLSLLETVDVSGIRLSFHNVVGDYPRRLTVSTSNDGIIWNRQWQGTTAGRVYAATVWNDSHPSIEIVFPRVRARYVALSQGSTPDMKAHWSMAEVRVLR